MPLIITPHPGEMARLLNIDVQKVNQSRLECARDFAREMRVIVVLKGPNTIIAVPSGKVFINLTGNPGMAKGGSGDVLAGMIAGLLAQGHPPEQAAVTAVHLHGEAGDRAAEERSQHCVTPSDIISFLPKVFLKYENRKPNENGGVV